MKDIKELAIEVAQDMGDDEGTDRWLIEFAQRLIAAYTEDQKPFAWGIEISGEPTDVWLNKDNLEREFNRRQDKYPDETRRFVPLYAAPPLTEPAAQGTVAQPTKVASALDGSVQTSPACAAPTVDSSIAQLVTALQDSKGWLRDYADSIIRDAIDRTAAPLPEEVQKMVERLYSDLDGGPSCWLKQEAADLIERLAAVNTNLNSENALLLKWKLEGVPEGYVVVPREPTGAMMEAGMYAGLNAPDVAGICSPFTAEAYDCGYGYGNGYGYGYGYGNGYGYGTVRSNKRRRLT